MTSKKVCAQIPYRIVGRASALARIPYRFVVKRLKKSKLSKDIIWVSCVTAHIKKKQKKNGKIIYTRLRSGWWATSTLN